MNAVTHSKKTKSAMIRRIRGLKVTAIWLPSQKKYRLIKTVDIPIPMYIHTKRKNLEWLVRQFNTARFLLDLSLVKLVHVINEKTKVKYVYLQLTLNQKHVDIESEIVWKNILAEAVEESKSCYIQYKLIRERTKKLK